MRWSPPVCSLAILVSVGLFAGVTAAVAQSGHEATQVRELAEERYAEGDFEQAALLFQRLAELEESDAGQAEILVTASWLEHLDGRRNAALGTLTRALVLNPEVAFDSDLYDLEFARLYQRSLSLADSERSRMAAQRVQKALVDLEQGQSVEAREQLEAAIRLSPDRPVALYNLALLDLNEGHRETAMAGFEKVVALSYSSADGYSETLRARALSSIGVIYSDEDRWQDAEESFVEAVALDPTNTTIWRNLGIARARQDRHSEAVDAFRQAYQASPQDADLARLLAHSLREIELTDEAARVLDEAISRAPGDAALLLESGLLELRQDNPSGAIPALERALALDPDNGSGVARRAATYLALALYEDGSYQRAAEMARRSLSWKSDQAETWNTLGLTQVASEQLPEAVESFTKASEIDSKRAEFLFNLGSAYVASGDFEQAEATYLRGLDIDPASESAQSSLAQIRARLDAERILVSQGRTSRSTATSRPVSPKKVGLRFADLNYRDLGLRGALVKEVAKKSPAARAGLRKGDLILWIGEYEVLDGRDFYQYLRRNPPADSLDLQYLRDGQTHLITVELRSG